MRMSKLLLLSLILFICSWRCCHYGSQQRAPQVVSNAAVGSVSQADTFSLEEDGDTNPYEEFGAFLFFVAFSIPLVLVIIKVMEKDEERKTGR